MFWILAGQGTVLSVGSIFLVLMLCFAWNNSENTALSEVFLDITGKVKSNSNEEGLLGLAFHPNYKTNGYFYVYYTADEPRRSIVSRFKVSDTNPNQANVTSEFVIIEIMQPYSKVSKTWLLVRALLGSTRQRFLDVTNGNLLTTLESC